MSNIKVKRIASDLCKYISEICANEANDSLLKTITITGSEVSSDLSYAKVYFTSISEMTPKELEKEMEEASGYIRTLVAERLDVRHTPRLKFIFDTSIEYGSKIEKIINELKESD